MTKPARPDCNVADHHGLLVGEARGPSTTCTPRPAIRSRVEFGATAPMTSFTCAWTAAKSTAKRVILMPKRAPSRTRWRVWLPPPARAAPGRRFF